LPAAFSRFGRPSRALAVSSEGVDFLSGCEAPVQVYVNEIDPIAYLDGFVCSLMWARWLNFIFGQCYLGSSCGAERCLLAVVSPSLRKQVGQSMLALGSSTRKRTQC
jgi:hypothetical protein